MTYCPSSDKTYGAMENLDFRDGLISLLEVCRRLYAEVVDLVYSSYVFHFNDLESLLSFTEIVPPQYMSLVRSIHLSYHLTFISRRGDNVVPNQADWVKAMSILAHETDGLKNLNMVVNQAGLFSMHGIWAQKREEVLFNMAKMIVLSQKWTLTTNWEDTGLEYGELPFHVIRKPS